MKIYIEDFLNQDPSNGKVSSAFHFFDPNIPAIGRVFGLITISGTGDYDPMNVSRLIWNGIQDSLRESEVGKNIEGIKNALEISKKKLAELIKHDDSLQEGVELDVGLLRYVGNVLYFGYYGSTRIFIFHENSMVDVSKLLEESNVNAGSTELSSGDIAGLMYGVMQKDLFTADSPVQMIEKLQALRDGKKIESLITSTTVDLSEMVEVVSKDIVIEESYTNEVNTLPLEEENNVEKNVDEESLTSVENGLDEKGSIEVGDIDELSNSSENNDDNVGIDLSDEQEASEKDETTVDTIGSEVMGSGLHQDTLGDLDIDGIDTDTAIHNKKEDVQDIDELEIGSREEELEAKGVNIDQLDADLDPGENIGEFVRAENETPSLNNEDPKKGKFNEKFSVIKDRVVDIVGKIADFVGNLIAKVQAWVSRYLFNKYGRKTWFKRLRAKLSQSRISLYKNPEIKVGDYIERSKRNKRLTIALVAIVLIVSGYFISQKIAVVKEANQIHRDFTAFEQSVNELIEQAKSNVSIDNETAKIALSKAENLISEKGYSLEVLTEEDWSKFEDLQVKVLDVKDEITRTVRVNESEGNLVEFLDLNITNGDHDLTDIAIYQDSQSAEKLVVTDNGEDNVLIVSLIDPSDYSYLDDPEKLIKEPLYVDIGNTGIFIFDNGSGVLKASFEDETKKSIGPIMKLSGVSKSGFGSVQIDEMAILTLSDNIYIIDSNQNSIYKSTGNEGNSYSIPYRFFTIEGENSSKCTDFFAGIYLYATCEEGIGVRRFVPSADGSSSPLEAPVSFVGLQSELTDVTAGFTNATLDDPLVVFDSEDRSFVVFEKPDENNGRHPNEMHFLYRFAYGGDDDDVFSNVKDFVLDSLNRKIYAIDGSRIWALEIAQ